MRRGPFTLAVAVLLAVAGAAYFLLRPEANAVVAESDEPEADGGTREAAALAAGGHARVDPAVAFAGATTGTLVGIVRRDGKPVAAHVAVHVRARPRPGQPLGDAEAGDDGGSNRVPPEDGGGEVLVSADTGADGAFRLVVPAPATHVRGLRLPSGTATGSPV